MAVHDLGYRAWSGTLSPAWQRPFVISGTGVRRAWRSSWLRRMLFFAWLPAMWFAIGFFIWEQSLIYPEWRDGIMPFLATAPPSSTLAEIGRNQILQDPTAARHDIWAWLLQSFFRYPQGALLVLVVGIIAPSLISQDIRSRAFLLYFSRPLRPFEYILGKSMTIWWYLLLISALPALALYLLGILLSPQLSVVWATWDLPLRILGASAALVVPTAALALALSSLTQESRIAGFAWFAIWILGWFTYGVMNAAHQFGPDQEQSIRWWEYVSLYHTLGRVQSWVFGFAKFSEVRWSALVLLLITTGSLIVLFRRVAAPMRV